MDAVASEEDGGGTGALSSPMAGYPPRPTTLISAQFQNCAAFFGGGCILYIERETKEDVYLVREGLFGRLTQESKSNLW